MTALEHDTVEKPAAILRGGARGLEIVVDGGAGIDAITAAVVSRIAEAPAFFRGSDVRIRIEGGPLAIGSLARLDELAAQFELRIVEVLAAKKDAVPLQQLAAGSAPVGESGDPQTVLPNFEPPAPKTSVTEPQAEPPKPAPGVDQLELALAALNDELLEVEMVIIEEPAPFASDVALYFGEPRVDPPPAGPPPAGPPPAGPPSAGPPPAGPPPAGPPPAAPPEPSAPPATRIVTGPVRSGVILEHRGHLIVFGDVNPGAEVRAEGNIVVLGRLRGTAHAGIGNDASGFILALRLEPQQLRIGRSVARASDSEPPGVPEIAHMTGKSIVVERYSGRLPNGLAASI